MKSSNGVSTSNDRVANHATGLPSASFADDAEPGSCYSRYKPTSVLLTLGAGIFSVSLLLVHGLIALVGWAFRSAMAVIIHRLLMRSEPAVEFLGGLDTAFGIDSRESPSIISKQMILRGKLDINQLRRVTAHRIVEARLADGTLRYPRSTQYVQDLCGYQFWCQEPSFRIEYHVDLQPGAPLRDQHDLNRLMGELAGQPFPPRTSPWKWLFIPLAPGFDGLDANSDHFLFILLTHHAIADGVALIRLCMDSMIDHDCSFPVNTSNTKKLSRMFDVGRLVRSVFTTPAASFAKMMLNESNALHGKRLSGRKLIAISSPIPLQLVKSVRVKTGSTVNDVVMSCIAGALRRHFESIDQPVPRKLIAFLPMSMHSFSAPNTLCNNCATLYYEVPVAETTPLRLLAATKRSMDRLKESDEVWVNLVLQKMLTNRMPNAITRAYYQSTSVTCIISNVPGPQEHCTMLGGHTLERLAFVLPNKGNVGVGFSVVSYNNQLQVGVIADGALVEGQQAVDAMVDAFEKELRALGDALD